MKFPRRGPRQLANSEATGHRRRPVRAYRPSLGLDRCEDRMMLSVSLVSVDSAGTGSGNGSSDFQTAGINTPGYGGAQADGANLSADGTELVFASDASNLVASVNDTNQASNVFVRNTQTGVTSLVSVTPDGDSGNGPSFDPQISPNGEYVAFESQATNLTDESGLTAGTSQSQAVGYLYVRNLQTGTTTLLEQTPSGQVGDGWSTGQFVFSPNSQDLAWVDTSDNLTGAPLDPNSSSNSGGWDPGPDTSQTYIYIRNLAAQTTSLVSVSTAGLASGDNPSDDIGASDGIANPDGIFDSPTLIWSPDSQSLVFSSSATDLTANAPSSNPNPSSAFGTSGNENLFLRNLSTGTTTLITVTTSGQLSAGDSFGAVFSPDGQSLAFESNAADLTANAADTTPLPTVPTVLGSLTSNIYIRNLNAGTTTLVSATPAGLQSNGTAGGPVFSPDGKSLAFMSDANDLVKNAPDTTPPPNAAQPGSPVEDFSPPVNLFLTNLASGTTTLVSVTPDGMMSNGTVGQAIFSPDGNLLAFTSTATDLTNNSLESTPPTVPGAPANPTGLPSDSDNVFVRNLTTQTTTLESPTTSGQLSNGDITSILFGPDSNSLFFVSGAVDLTSNPPDSSGFPGDISNLFVRDLSAGTTSLISATTSGQLSDSEYTNTLLSPTGQTVYFDSTVEDLTSGDANNATYPAGIFEASEPFTVTNQLQFASWNVAANESSGKAVVTVQRSGPATAAASVNYTVQDGSAHAGTDYKATSGTLTFAAGQTSGTFTVPLITSDSFSGTRSANLVLSSPQGASLGYPSAFLSLTATPSPSSPGKPVTPTPVIPTAVIPTPVTPTPVTPEPGPAVVGVASLESRHGLTSVVVTFNQALDSASAEDVANYEISLPGHIVRVHGSHSTATRLGRSLAIETASYDALTHQVTLTIRSRLRRGQTYQFQINGASGGLKGTSGIALGSSGASKPGNNYQGELELTARRS
jgi:Calx-beta domain/WD40-like Beta Propeller Repeat